MAFTGILATMPYIALQLVGIEVVLEVMGIGSESANWFIKDLPLFVAFAVLAAYTYSSGLRAPALIAFVKDTLIYIVIFVAILYLPSQFGGWGSIFSAASRLLRCLQRRERRRDRGRRGVAEERHPRPSCCTGPTRRWPSGRRWRCSCTRTRSRRCSPRVTAR